MIKWLRKQYILYRLKRDIVSFTEKTFDVKLTDNQKNLLELLKPDKYAARDYYNAMMLQRASFEVKPMLGE